MGFFDFFGSSDLQYPTVPTGNGPQRPCGDGPYQPPDAAGIFNQLFAPTQLPYPLPSCGYGARRRRRRIGGTLSGAPATRRSGRWRYGHRGAHCRVPVLASNTPSASGTSSTPPVSSTPSDGRPRRRRRLRLRRRRRVDAARGHVDGRGRFVPCAVAGDGGDQCAERAGCGRAVERTRVDPRSDDAASRRPLRPRRSIRRRP